MQILSKSCNRLQVVPDARRVVAAAVRIVAETVNRGRWFAQWRDAMALSPQQVFGWRRRLKKLSAGSTQRN
jgi:hypothetical protein